MTILSGLYQELVEQIGLKIPEIKWVDLWHNQVHPAQSQPTKPAPAVFIKLKSMACNDMGDNVQSCNYSIDLMLYAPSSADFSAGISSAPVDYLSLIDRLHQLFHGTDGEYYSSMLRTAVRHKKSDGKGYLYCLSFCCTVNDSSTEREYVYVSGNDVSVRREEL